MLYFILLWIAYQLGAAAFFVLSLRRFRRAGSCSDAQKSMLIASGLVSPSPLVVFFYLYFEAGGLSPEGWAGMAWVAVTLYYFPVCYLLAFAGILVLVYLLLLCIRTAGPSRRAR